MITERAHAVVVANRRHRLRNAADTRIAFEAGSGALDRLARDAAALVVAPVVEGTRVAIVTRGTRLVGAPLRIAEHRRGPDLGRTRDDERARRVAIDRHREHEHRRRHLVYRRIVGGAGERDGDAIATFGIAGVLGDDAGIRGAARIGGQPRRATVGAVDRVEWTAVDAHQLARTRSGR